jgi:nicotinate-nucleotide--dimethylbenzimidazole phosphoribosyltransferase
LIIEKSHEKIKKSEVFLRRTEIECKKETNKSEFDVIINACPDYIAFCQEITKVGKGGHISFFSGLTKNEHIETNLLNLMHYKEIELSGAYGLTRDNMRQAIPFLEKHGTDLGLLIEDIVAPIKAPALIEKVLSGQYFKYIVDVSGSLTGSDYREKSIKHPLLTVTQKKGVGINDLDKNSLCRYVIEHIEPVNNTLLAGATEKIDEKAKPLGALGRLEDLAVQMCLIQNSLYPAIRKKTLFVFAGDHGITEEGVSAYPSEVTGQMVENFLNGGAAINVLCRHHGIEMKVVDMGVIAEFDNHPNLIKKKVNKGTKNFAIEDAMTVKEMIIALENGMETFLDAYEKEKIDIVGLGEMGIGNTTSASAIISVITGLSPSQTTGRGTGVDDKGLKHKTSVIERALNFHTPDSGNGFEILCKIGGFEIAGITGAVLAAASKKTAVVLDGVISTAAGLIAYIINPDIKGYLISSHKSVERAHIAALSFIGLDPLIDFRMRLGEGTGATMAMDAAEADCKIMSQMASFDDAKISRSSKALSKKS